MQVVDTSGGHAIAGAPPPGQPQYFIHGEMLELASHDGKPAIAQLRMTEERRNM